MRDPIVRAEGFWADFVNGFFLRPVYRCTPVSSSAVDDSSQESAHDSSQNPEGVTATPEGAEIPTRNPETASPRDPFNHNFNEAGALWAVTLPSANLASEHLKAAMPDFESGLDVAGPWLHSVSVQSQYFSEVRQKFDEAWAAVERTYATPDSAVLYLMVKDAQGHLEAVDPRNPEHADLLKEAIREIGEHPASALRLEPPRDAR